MSEPGTGSDLPSVRRREWRTVSPEDCRRIEAIWEEAFPPAERSAHDTVSCRNSTWLWTAHSADGRLTGFATALSLPESGAAYLEYLAVQPTERGSGTGAAVLAAIVDDLRADPSVQGIVLEVEDPVRTPGRDPLLARRVAFYERWGARPVTSLGDYSMPDLANPGGLVPMIVLWRGIRDNPVLPPDAVVRVLTDLYHGYYAHAASEGHLEEMLDRMTLVSP
ncbi:GNAT family N-acetyltransferase [Actinosynnema sp. NPDC023658]|uniref:GNAT family N-acetyltransferase n=1 Tax=Actinosynnema sp. NPDC023658 TaxID=3155465 RepID=UPI00340351AD